MTAPIPPRTVDTVRAACDVQADEKAHRLAWAVVRYVVVYRRFGCGFRSAHKIYKYAHKLAEQQQRKGHTLDAREIAHTVCRVFEPELDRLRKSRGRALDYTEVDHAICRALEAEK